MVTKMNNILPRVLLASSFIMLTLFWPGAEADLAELEGWSWRRQLQQWPVILTLTHKYKYTVDDVFWMYSNMELGNGNNKKIQQILGSRFWNTSLEENNSERGNFVPLEFHLRPQEWRLASCSVLSDKRTLHIWNCVIYNDDVNGRNI